MNLKTASRHLRARHGRDWRPRWRRPRRSPSSDGAGPIPRARSRPITSPSRPRPASRSSRSTPTTPRPRSRRWSRPNNVTVDVASVEYADAVRLCDEGLLETIDHSILAPAPDGTPATEDFLPGALTECLRQHRRLFDDLRLRHDQVRRQGADDHRRLLRHHRLPRQARHAQGRQGEPRDGADGRRRSRRRGLRHARHAGGHRARLRQARHHQGSDVVWWEAGAQPPQLLADGEVALTTGYNGRIFAAAIGEGKPFEIVWDGQVYELEGYVIPKGAPNLERGAGVREVRHQHRAAGQGGGMDQLRPAPQVLRAAGRHRQAGRQDRDGAEPADLRGEPQRTRWPRPTSSGSTTTPS